MLRRALVFSFGWLLFAVSPALAIDCSRDSTGLVPLIDLGARTYQGFPGGLYPGSSNQRPAAHEAAGVTIAHSLVPLDTLGHPDPNGRIVLISVGMSNCTLEFRTFVPLAMNDAARNPHLLVVDCAEGGQTAHIVRDPTSAYWDTVAARLHAHGSSLAQVQAVWIKEANARPTGGFPAATDSLLWDLGGVVRTIKAKMPNTQVTYLTSRIYAGYATTDLNPEPYAYESGFAVKWLLEAQIAGVDSLSYGTGQAPWLSWGPYLWADGLRPRSDGFTWPCAAFQSDGTHPSTLGQEIVADSLLAFFSNDETATPWFLSNQTTSAPVTSARVAFTASPNPSRGEVTLRFQTAEPWRLVIADASGRRVRDLGAGAGAGAPVSLSWNGRDQGGRRVPAGIYWARLTLVGGSVTTRLVRD
jgi:hypothetical protein